MNTFACMNKNISSAEIRELFLTFFEEKDHLRIPAARLLPKNDPTLLYINSGMAAIKGYFTGEERPPHPDLCNVQPCIRTRDIDDVGDRHHLTFFEMMGSWSIGDYFKERAIELAYELLVQRLGFPEDRLYVSVYGGNTAINLPPDEESAAAWEKVGLRRDKIVVLFEDNFWGPAGETGACGPCTEMFYDTGEEFGPTYTPGGEFDSGRYIEVWNAGVFMEFNKQADGTFEKLRFTSVDTGSGVERMAMVMNGLDTVYETDVMRPFMEMARDEIGDVPLTHLRVLTDHLRALAFMLAEDVWPSNEGRGYVPRRLIRKCVALATRHGKPGFPFSKLLHAVVDAFTDTYPYLGGYRREVSEKFEKERADFMRVIDRGLVMLDDVCGQAPFTVSGKDAFALVSTYGMPINLVEDFVEERGGAVDMSAYQEQWRAHQEISRAGRKGEGDEEADGWPRDLEHLEGLAEQPPTRFVGYQKDETTGRVIALFKDAAAVDQAVAGERVEVVTDETALYAESGGQAGDTGIVRGDGLELHVVDTVKSAHGHFVHRALVHQGVLRAGAEVALIADPGRRRKTKANHSATHLLHKALRTVLGEHVKQGGSQVTAQRLRFDFHHPAKVSEEDLEQVERLVNHYITLNIQSNIEVMGFDAALERGALAFFEDKYGDEVRVVQFGDLSAELCGGTHVDSTGEIGLFRILAETSVAQGIRRIAAVTGDAAVDMTLKREAILRQVARRLSAREDQVLERLEKAMAKPAKKDQATPEAGLAKEDVEKSARALSNGTRYIGARLDDGPAQIRNEALRIAEEIGGVACLAGIDAEKGVRVAIAIAKKLTSELNAGQALKELAAYIDGRGGGKPHLAQGGGANPDGIDAMFDQLGEVLERQLR